MTLDPLSFAPAITLAYDLAEKPAIQDVVWARDWDRKTRPFGAVIARPNDVPLVGISGTEDFDDALNDLLDWPEKTPQGDVAYGALEIFESFWLESGKPIESLKGADWTAHSLGCGPAGCAVLRGWARTYCLFAPPRFFGPEAIANLLKTPGMLVAVDGDPVPGVPLLWPELPISLRLKAPAKSIDPIWYHHWATYLLALQGTPPAGRVLTAA